jgi:hypothetical protein
MISSTPIERQIASLWIVVDGFNRGSCEKELYSVGFKPMVEIQDHTEVRSQTRKGATAEM